MQFFETVVRYDKFFNQEPQFIPEILVSKTIIKIKFKESFTFLVS